MTVIVSNTRKRYLLSGTGVVVGRVVGALGSTVVGGDDAQRPSSQNEKPAAQREQASPCWNGA